MSYFVRDQRGVAQIIVNFAAIAIFITIVLFGTQIYKFIITYNEVVDMSKNELRDAMKVNNGLTPSVEGYIRDRMIAKGFDTDRLTITGTISPVPFGTQMTGSIIYEYQLPIFQEATSLFPDIDVQAFIMEAPIQVYALGIVR